MLVITRAKGKSLHIGDDVIVKFLGLTEDGEARIGIEAPRDINIVREEIKARRELENQPTYSKG